ncbi:MAG: UDP-3-O-(3-hydroxymyristoyl)glucosamine N-acyltransferase [Candidatus Omnitrophota bacterium]|jgi:UDP-3-O-[3-hydroxymyristoyl] glucosamine N-acyltransferase
MPKTLKEIAKFIGGEVVGDGSVVITGVAGIQDAREGDLTFLSNPKYLPFLERTSASAVITSPEIQSSSKPLIRTDNPSLAFTKVVSLIIPQKVILPAGIHPTAVVGKDVRLGKGAALGAHVVVEDKAVIGDRTVIYANCYIGSETVIDSDCVIYPTVTIREQVSIGKRVVIYSGTVIGSYGFGFVAVDGVNHRIPQIGTVVIEDDVEIGSNCAIDRARFDKTVIGQGTKLDNLVHIAHNVRTGRNCLILGQCAISGSSKIGNNVILAGQTGLVGHIELGDNVVVMAKSGVSKSVPENTTVWGSPAKPEKAAKEINACVHNLPRFYKTLTELKKRVEELESELKKKQDV